MSEFTPPKSAPEGLRFLAHYFDAMYQDAGKNDEVQRDLRAWADEYERIKAEIAPLVEVESALMREVESLRAELARYQKSAHKEIADLHAVIKADRAELARYRDEPKPDPVEEIRENIKGSNGCSVPLHWLETLLARIDELQAALAAKEGAE